MPKSQIPKFLNKDGSSTYVSGGRTKSVCEPGDYKLSNTQVQNLPQGQQGQQYPYLGQYQAFTTSLPKPSKCKGQPRVLRELVADTVLLGGFAIHSIRKNTPMPRVLAQLTSGPVNGTRSEPSAFPPREHSDNDH